MLTKLQGGDDTNMRICFRSGIVVNPLGCEKDACSLIFVLCALDFDAKGWDTFYVYWVNCFLYKHEMGNDTLL